MTKMADDTAHIGDLVDCPWISSFAIEGRAARCVRRGTRGSKPNSMTALERNPEIRPSLSDRLTLLKLRQQRLHKYYSGH